MISSLMIIGWVIAASQTSRLRRQADFRHGIKRRAAAPGSLAAKRKSAKMHAGCIRGCPDIKGARHMKSAYLLLAAAAATALSVSAWSQALDYARIEIT